MSQPVDNLPLANSVRLNRAALKRSVKAREVTLRDVLDAEIPDWLIKMPVGQLLFAAPWVHRTEILRALRRAHVGELRPIGTIPLRQRRVLVDELEQLRPSLRGVA